MCIVSIEKFDDDDDDDDDDDCPYFCPPSKQFNECCYVLKSEFM